MTRKPIFTVVKGKTSRPASPLLTTYLTSEIKRLADLGRQRSSESMRHTLNTVRAFLGDAPSPRLDAVDASLIDLYEAYLRRKRGLRRNSSSFYLRVLRAAYNRGVEAGLTPDLQPFRHAYTGVDRTTKRALTLSEIRRIKELDLSHSASLELARDLFLFSFYMRGMSFVDMAFLRKSDVKEGFVQYCRRKTGQRLTVELTEEAAELVRRHPSSTSYLLPIIRREGKEERQQYRNRLVMINRHLKRVGAMAELHIPLTTYVSRHAWATIARGKNVPLAVISEGLGHDSEHTTQIYLASIRSSAVDKANRQIINGI